MSASKFRWSPRTWIGIVMAPLLMFGFASDGLAQRPKTAAKKPDAKKKAEETAEVIPVHVGAEVFRDNLNRRYLDNKYDQLFPRGESIVQQQVDQVRAMAEKGNINKALLKTYVQHAAKELTSHANIEAMLDTQKGASSSFLKLEEAANRLAIPLEAANLKGNALFRKAFVQEMLAPGVGDALIKNHLYARVQFMIALANSAEPEALDFFNGVLGDKDQPGLMKLEAARGISRVVAGGKKAESIDANTRVKSAKALSDFLRAEPQTIWPALDRALEALGALRLDSFDPGRGDLDFLATASLYLAKAQTPELRARATWAIGMMRINPNGKVAYPLLAAHAGTAAIELAERALGEYNPSAEPLDLNAPVRYWTARLIAEVGLGLKGDPDLPESGLVTQSNRAGRDDARAVGNVEEKVREVCKAADALTKAVGALRTTEKANFAKTIAELRALLAEDPPKETKLFPNGPDLPFGGTEAATGR